MGSEMCIRDRFRCCLNSEFVVKMVVLAYLFYLGFLSLHRISKAAFIADESYASIGFVSDQNL